MKKRSSYIHFVVDLQDEFISEVPDHVVWPYAQRLRNFSDRLYDGYGIPTMVIAFGEDNEFQLHADVITNPSLHNRATRQHVIKHYGLDRMTPRAVESLVLKGHADAFYKNELSKILRNNNFKGIILSGMDSSECIASTAHGAILNGFRGIIIDDLLLDSLAEDKKRCPPARHRKLVTKMLNNAETSKVLFAHSGGFFSREGFARNNRPTKLTTLRPRRNLLSKFQPKTVTPPAQNPVRSRRGSSRPQPA